MSWKSLASIFNKIQMHCFTRIFCCVDISCNKSPNALYYKNCFEHCFQNIMVSLTLINLKSSRPTYDSIKSHKKLYTWTASSLSSVTGNHVNQTGSSSSMLMLPWLCCMILVTAAMAFSVALTFSLARDSGSWMIAVSCGIASVEVVKK